MVHRSGGALALALALVLALALALAVVVWAAGSRSRAAPGGSPTAEPTPTEVTLAAPATPPPPPDPAATESPTPGAAPEQPTVVAVPTLQVGPDTLRPPSPDTVRVPPIGSCHIANGLPDHTCTPGLLNPRLTPDQLCGAGFTTRSIRPSTSYTDALKKRLMGAYGQVGLSPLTGRPWSAGDVELDHVVSLEDLGHPWSPLNLWPQPRRATGAEPNAEEKDAVELVVHKLICSDPSHAADYAARLAADWTQFRRTARSLVDTAPKETEP